MLHFVLKPARRGLMRRKQWVVVLKAANGRTLMTSETYNNRRDAVVMTHLIRDNAANALINQQEQ